MNVLNEYYVRTGAVPSGQDQRIYDIGDFSIATGGLQAAVGVIGELYIEYDIEFTKPKLVGGAFGGNVSYAHYLLGGTIAAATPWGTSLSSGANNSLSLTFNNSAKTITLNNIQEGSYVIQYTSNGTNAVAAAPIGFGATTNCTAINLFVNQTASVANYIDGLHSFTTLFAFNITGTAPVITLNTTNGIYPTTGQFGDIFVFQIPIGAT